MIAPLERPEPFIGTDEARHLAEIVAALPPPEKLEETGRAPSPEWLDGWGEAKTLAVGVIMAAAGL